MIVEMVPVVVTEGKDFEYLTRDRTKVQKDQALPRIIEILNNHLSKEALVIIAEDLEEAILEQPTGTDQIWLQVYWLGNE